MTLLWPLPKPKGGILFDFLRDSGCGSVTHGKCPPSFHCGNLGDIRFPFTNTERPDCGLLTIHNCEDRDPEAIKTIKSKGKWFFVTILNDSTISFTDNYLHDNLLSRSCGIFSQNSTFTADSPFFNASMKPSVILFTCSRALNLSVASPFSKSTICPQQDIFYNKFEDSVTQDFFSLYTYKYYSEKCLMVQLPAIGDGLEPNATVDPFNLVSDEMTIEVQVNSGCSSCYHLNEGQCQLDENRKFFCAREKEKSRKVLVATVASVTGALGVSEMFTEAKLKRGGLCNQGLMDGSNPCKTTRGNGTLGCIPLSKPCQNPNVHFFWDAFHQTDTSICKPVSIRKLVKL
ncbi:hypothetical protein L6164_006612 [Bauhinia variegata]|uniref:Uncharacterized protein n=1 Tax=Bauhinia variegata TaxID=167791 RepID=A0ACB9PU74_BAUVA|nr:hypothetical protein L6164_006612 [Bauhinia variegata]